MVGAINEDSEGGERAYRVVTGRTLREGTTRVGCLTRPTGAWVAQRLSGPRSRVSNDLLIPYALDTLGGAVLPADAKGGVIYTCPECRARLRPRAGEKIRRHFFHPAGTTHCPFFAPETRDHSLAKHAAHAVILTWLRGQWHSPFLVRECPTCGKRHPRPLSERIKGVALEHTVGQGEDRIKADVCLLDGEGRPLLAVEVLVSHAVDERKAEKLRRLRLPGIELHAHDLLANPKRWEVVKEFFLKPDPCLDPPKPAPPPVATPPLPQGVPLPVRPPLERARQGRAPYRPREPRRLTIRTAGRHDLVDNLGYCWVMEARAQRTSDLALDCLTCNYLHGVDAEGGRRLALCLYGGRVLR